MNAVVPPFVALAVILAVGQRPALAEQPEPDQPSGSDGETEPDPEQDETTTPPRKRRVVVSPGGLRLERRGISWDVTVTGGLRLWDSDGDPSEVWMARIRGGVLLYSTPTFVVGGVSVQAGAFDTPTFAFEVAGFNVERGVWGQLGAGTDGDGAILSGSLGYTLFGLEYQRRLSGENEGDQALFLNLQVPLGVIWVSLQPLR